MGYGVSFVFAFAAWYLISKYILYEGEKGDNKNNTYWRIAQWITTGWLWSTWLSHDMANIMVFLPKIFICSYYIFSNTYFRNNAPWISFYVL